MSNYLESFPGTVVQWVINEMRKFDHAATAYQNMPDESKDALLNGLIERAEELSQNLVDEVQRQGLRTVKGSIKSVTFKQAGECAIVFSKNEQYVAELALSSGGPIQLLLPQQALDLTPPEQTTIDDAIEGADEKQPWTPPGEDDDEQLTDEDIEQMQADADKAIDNLDSPFPPTGESFDAEQAALEGDDMPAPPEDFQPEEDPNDPPQPKSNIEQCPCTADENGVIVQFNPRCRLHGNIGGSQDERVGE